MQDNDSDVVALSILPHLPHPFCYTTVLATMRAISVAILICAASAAVNQSALPMPIAYGGASSTGPDGKHNALSSSHVAS